MSCSYAEGLSPYENKGKLGLPESVDKREEFDKKVKQLSEWIEESNHVVIHTGAGISTAAGIPDFRGPNGVWTLEKKGIKPTVNISFDDAKPTPTHMAILELVKQGKVHYVVSQNIDALHLRSGLSRKHLAELHGNMYVDQCSKCERQFVRKSATNSVGQKNLNTPCPYQGPRPCRGTLHDTILDWEHNLPLRDINLGDYNSSIADLSICLGTTLQINPSGMLPTYTKKYNQGKLVICNLSSTKHDKKADLVIRGYVDDILVDLMKHLGLTIPEYDETLDPSRRQKEPYLIEWTLLESDVAKVKRKYEEKMRENKKRKMKKENVKEEMEEKLNTRNRKVKQHKEENDEQQCRREKGRSERDIKRHIENSLKLEEEESEEELKSKKRKVKQHREEHGGEQCRQENERSSGERDIKRNIKNISERQEKDCEEELKTKKRKQQKEENNEEDRKEGLKREKCNEETNRKGSSERGIKRITEDDVKIEEVESEDVIRDELIPGKESNMEEEDTEKNLKSENKAETCDREVNEIESKEQQKSNGKSLKDDQECCEERSTEQENSDEDSGVEKLT